MGRPKNKKTANEETKPEPQAQEEQKVDTAEKEVATYPQKEAETIKVRAADGTQLYDPVSRKLYTDDKGGTEAREGDQFVVTNLNRGKLKKV